MNMMNIKTLRNSPRSLPRKAAGMTLLDILLAIVIFAVGMIALAQLQGNLSRSSGDANARTVAANIAEEVIESLRTYDRLEVDAADACPTALDAMQTKKVFECIADPAAQLTLARGGINYTVDLAVTDWYYTGDRETLTSDTSHEDLQGRDLSISDFKGIQVTVDWDVIDFRVDEASTADLGTGSFVANTTIPSIPVLGGAKIAADDDGLPGTPPVAYTPGQLPDVVPISLNNSKFKESTTPMPDVVVRDQIVETWFDSITYAQSTGYTYLRREEFAVVSCECTLRFPTSAADKTGFLPTTWNGDGYTEGEWVSKPYGESANNQQSQYCSTCCRDHHDSANHTGADQQYDPFGDWTESNGSGNHRHWGRSKQGNNSGLVEATKDGDTYVEACRLVRKDGFMRVAQDFRQEQMQVVPQSWFNSTANVDDYSTYVTGEVDDFYKKGDTEMDPMLGLPGATVGTAVSLPTATFANSDQQVSRAIYVDHVTAEAQDVIDDCAKGNTPTDKCPEGVDAGQWIQVYPFYELQTTWLSFWEQRVPEVPVTVTNEFLSDDNTHSRGLATVNPAGADGHAEVATAMHRGNVGLTATDPISPDNLHYTAGGTDAMEYVCANGCGGAQPPSTTWSFEGSLTSFANKPRAADVTMSGDGVICSKNDTLFTCAIDQAAGAPKLVLSNYETNKSDPLWICMAGGAYPVTSVIQPTGANQTIFNLSTVGADVSGIILNIQETQCD